MLEQQQQETILASQSFPKKVIPLTGKWIPANEGADLALNYKQLTNLRYTDTHLKGIGGMTKINSAAVMNSTYMKARSAFHYAKTQPVESHLLVQAYNTGLTASQILQNKTAIPGVGSFEEDPLWTDATGAERGYFSIAPSEHVVYCNSKENLIWGGDESRIGGFFIANPDSQVIYDYTARVQNTMSDAQNVATMTTTGGGIDSYTKVTLHGENNADDDSGNSHNFTFNGAYSTANPKFGTYCFSFNGSSQYMYCADHADFDQSGGVWTIDTWVNFSSFNAVSTIWSLATDANNYNRLYVNTSGIVIYNLVISSAEKSTIQSGIGSVQLGRWHHIELTENGDNYYLFIDGVKVATQNMADRPADYTSYFAVGAFYNGSAWAGYSPFLLDEFRMSAGAARHTDGFTPQASAYSTSSSSTLYVIATRPLQGIKLYMETVNTAVASVASDYWTGTGYSLTAAPIDYMEYANDAAAQAAYVSSDTSTDVTLDLMEYSSDALAQAAYVSSAPGLGISEVDYMEYSSDALAQAAYVTDAAYGSDILSSVGTGITASSEYSTYYDHLSCDDNDGTSWLANVASDGYVQSDSGAGVTKVVQQISIKPELYSGYSRVKDWELHASNDGFASQDVVLTTGQHANNSDVETYNFYNSTGYRYHRLVITSDWYASRINPGIIEWQLKEISLQGYSDSSVKSQGSYALKGFAMATSALNKTLTRTINEGTGGTITHSGGYTIHTFTSNGTFNPGHERSVEYLIVAGGGGGGYNYDGSSTAGGGGGAGGIISNSDTVSGDKSVVVGAGGTGSCTNNVNGTNGNNSSFNGETATGGGGGATYIGGSGTGRAGGNGGSGGGGSYGGAGGTGVAGQGYAGGAGSTGTGQPGGGGGGASEVGTAGASGAHGGDGVTSSISGSSVTYGGGGGGGIGTGTAGNGGAGGGGAGGSGSTPGGDGTDGLGGGGGAGGAVGVGGGDGGDGVVIIRYITEVIDLSGIDTLRFSIRSSRTGANIKVGLHDSGGTTTEITPNITVADTFQTVTWDISGVTNANKDAIDQIIITIVNADAANTFYVDNFYSGVLKSLQSYSESTIKTQGSYALKGVALITDSLNETLTRTISSPIDLSNIETLHFDIRASRMGINLTVAIHDSGGTWTSISPNILAVDTFQTVTWDISAVANADKDAIDQIRVTVDNASAENTFYIDNFYASGPPVSFQSYSEASIKTQGDYALKGVAAQTASLSKTLTRTIASPIDLTGVSTIGFDIQASRTGSNIKIGLHDSGGVWTEITPNITVADTFQSVVWNIASVPDADKNAIDQVRITVMNADAANTFYLDNLGPAGGALYDGTATVGGTKTLGQTGLISFGNTVGLAKPKMYNGLVGYLYRFTFTGIDPTTKVYHATVDAPIQPIVDQWDGVERSCMAFYVYKNSTYNDYTLNVYENEYDATDTASFVELDSLAAGTNKLYFASYERLMGINFGLIGGHVNTTAATAMTIRYSSDGQNFVTVGTLDDGTSEGDISFSKSGTVTWDPPLASGEFMSKVSKATPRYHYEITFDKALSADVQLYYMSGIPVQRTFGQYKFPLMAQDMLFLCCDMSGKKNAAIHSEYQTSQIFNGTNSTEVEFGETGELTCGASLYNLYGYNLYNLIIFFKDSEMWKLSGNFPDWQRHLVSDSIGCPAPLTLKAIGLPGDIPQGLSRNVIIWQGGEGVYVSDGRAALPIHDDIANYFDKLKSEYIKPSLIGESWADIDLTKMEYHLHVASGSTATEPNTELVFDLKRWKWFKIDRGTGKKLVCGATVRDTDGNFYNYGFIDTGYMMRLEDGTDFDGNDIVHTLELGDLVFAENDFTKETRTERVQLITVAKTATPNDINYTHFVDTETIGTAYTMAPRVTGKRLADIVLPVNSKVGVFHSGKFEMTTNNEPVGFEPLALAYIYSFQSEKMTTTT